MDFGMMGIFDTAAQQSSAFAQQGIDAQLNKKQREWMERREDLQYERGWNVMNYQNWYNSPEQQMSRFRQAGLNPHLIYGRGTAGNTGTSTPQMGNRGKYDNKVTPMHQPAMLEKFQQMRLMKEQTDLVAKQVALTEQKKLTEIIDRYGKYQDSRRKKVLADYSTNFAEQDLQKKISEVRKNLANITLIDSQRLVNKARESYIRESEKWLPDTGSNMSIFIRNAKQWLQKNNPMDWTIPKINGKEYPYR